MMDYYPPYRLTNRIVSLVAEISEYLGKWSMTPGSQSPQLRRSNRIKTIQASLAIENNTLTLEQITALLEGKRILGLPQEIQEVHNAFTAYQQLENWQANQLSDLLAAHKVLMNGLVDRPGKLRSGNVGIYREQRLLHMAPPASRVSDLITSLFDWLSRQQEHPLIASCVFHYEFEFIHPFTDGNGRMGRLWQTRLLSQWKPILAYLPVESVIKDRQEDYYHALSQSDALSDSTTFIEFMLSSLSIAIKQALLDQPDEGITAQDSAQASAQVERLLACLKLNERVKGSELIRRLALSHRGSFRQYYLLPALNAGWVAMTHPATPSSPAQRYFLTPSGWAMRSWLLADANY
ncbi:Fic family protein [Budvicia diplopodorum]|uniref:Fic family protein n=1 Tax=Budvicia diplopodorum TaxID=1119056 RepID=UPI00135A18AD|nr:Fic family protein [Budvicia diplopodorum]